MEASKDLDLKSIQRKFAEWRRSKRHGDPIPANLWDEFHAIEGRFGRTLLSQRLGLNASDVALQMELRGAPPRRDAAGPIARPAAARPAARPVAASAPGPLHSTPTSGVTITKVVAVPFAPREARAGGVAEVVSPSGWTLRLHEGTSAEWLRTFVEAMGGKGACL